MRFEELLLWDSATYNERGSNLNLRAVQNRINTNKVTKAETKHLVTLDPIKVTLRRFFGHQEQGPGLSLSSKVWDLKGLGARRGPS